MNLTTIQKRTFLFLAVLKTRPHLIIGIKPTYRNVKNYMQGYLAALRPCIGREHLEGLTEYYLEKFNSDAGTAGSVMYYISHHFRGKTDQEKINILSDIIKGYLIEVVGWSEEE